MKYFYITDVCIYTLLFTTWKIRLSVIAICRLFKVMNTLLEISSID